MCSHAKPRGCRQECVGQNPFHPTCIGSLVTPFKLHGIASRHSDPGRVWPLPNSRGCCMRNLHTEAACNRDPGDAPKAQPKLMGHAWRWGVLSSRALDRIPTAQECHHVHVKWMTPKLSYFYALEHHRFPLAPKPCPSVGAEQELERGLEVPPRHRYCHAVGLPSHLLGPGPFSTPCCQRLGLTPLAAKTTTKREQGQPLPAACSSCPPRPIPFPLFPPVRKLALRPSACLQFFLALLFCQPDPSCSIFRH